MHPPAVGVVHVSLGRWPVGIAAVVEGREGRELEGLGLVVDSLVSTSLRDH